MPLAPHFVFYATPHGYGHAAIITALIKSVLDLYPAAKVSLVSTVPRTFFSERLGHRDFNYFARPCAADFGMVMASASRVLLEESARSYLAAHRHWTQAVTEESEFLHSIKPDLVVSCAAYLPLAAAQRLGIPNLSIGPFTWLGIAASFFGNHPQEAALLDPMREAYGQATALFATTPALPWEDCITDQRVVIGPIGLPCQDSPETLRRLRERFFLAEEKIALISLGGIPESLHALETWPRESGWRWLAVVPEGHSFQSPAITCLSQTELSVPQAIACSDVVITKPGYGTYVEAACAGTPLLYRSRPGWPETPGLANWFSQYAGIGEMSDSAFETGEILPNLQALLSVQRTALGLPTGNREAALHIRSILG